MYISEISIHGFKSFANKEKLSFGDGITAVVGPNGCGKTNIVDAVRWVLGEQKITMLRSSTLDDIIFNGSESLKPLSVCEVSLKVQNNRGILPIEYDEVEISRRIFRDGESEYMINRNICRLKDIISLFVDTGMGSDAYSVIELKMIEDILSDSTNSRRKMFEEASGINKYRQDRKLTLLKLKSTKTDLERLNDIISEVDTKVNGLQLQMKRFKRHESLVEKLKANELQLASIKVKILKNEIEPLIKVISEIKNNKDLTNSNQQLFEGSLRKLRSDFEIQQKKIKIAQTQIDDYSLKKQKNSNQIIVLNEKINNSSSNIIKLNNELSDGNEKIILNNKTIQELSKNIKILKPELEQNLKEYNLKKIDLEKSEIKLIETRKSYQSNLDQQIHFVNTTNDIKSNELRTTSLINEKNELINVLNKENKNHDLKVESISNEVKLLKTELIKLNKTNNQQIKDSEKLSNEKNKKEYELSKIENNLNKNINILASLNSQKSFYEEMIISGEGFSLGNKYILNHKNEFDNVYGAISDLIKIEDKYKNAINALLGPLAQAIICKNKKTCIDIIGKLDNQKVGQSWLISLDDFKSKDSFLSDLKSNEGFNYITSNEKYINLFKLIFKNKYIVKNQEEALNLLEKNDFYGEIADFDGNLYSSFGLIISKSDNINSSLLGRNEKLEKIKKEIKSLDRENDVIEKKIKFLVEKIENFNQQINRKDETIISSSSEITTINNKISQKESLIFEFRIKLEQNNKIFSSTKKEITVLEENFNKLKPELKKVEKKLFLIEKEIKKSNAQLEIDRNERDNKNLLLQNSRIKMVSLESKIENIQFRLNSSEEIVLDIKKRNKEIESETLFLDEEILKMKKEKNDFEKNNNEFNLLLEKIIKDKSGIDENFNSTYKEIQIMEQKISDEQKENEDILNKIKDYELKIVEKKSELKNIHDSFEDKYSIKIPEIHNITQDETELYDQIQRIKTSIENIGPINMAVNDEFDEESKRLSFLNDQKEDLETSEKTLIDTMENIDKEAREKFLNTFEKIKNNYKKTFQMFFDGGESDLNLIGDDDPLDADIEIFAKPPGKHTRNLRMLSSGEKSLTAIALLFAIYLVKPSPFCILDEVDAPLDDNNVLKFTNVLKQFSKNTQFIIVTHNKLTMESAQSLYGVTMQKSGVSKIVSVKLD